MRYVMMVVITITIQLLKQTQTNTQAVNQSVTQHQIQANNMLNQVGGVIVKALNDVCTVMVMMMYRWRPRLPK